MKRWLVLLLLISVLAVPVSAEEKVGIGIYVLSVEDFDIATGRYILHFLFAMRCGETPCSIDDILLINGRMTDVEVMRDREEISEANPFHKVYRVRAELDERIDLHEYPFDDQELTIIFESKKERAEQPIYEAVPGFISVDPRVYVPGWDVQSVTGRSIPFVYKFGATEFSVNRFKFGMVIDRSASDAVFKNFIPMFLLILIMLLTFILDLDKLELRIGIVSSVLIASVVFHLAMAGALPPVGYLTFPDKFMMLTYLVTLATFFLNIIILREIQAKKKGLAKFIYQKSKFWGPVLILLAYVAIFFFI